METNFSTSDPSSYVDHSLKNGASNATSDTIDKIKESMSDLKQRGNSIANGAAEYVRARPLTYLAFAVSAGFVIGKLLQRN